MEIACSGLTMILADLIVHTTGEPLEAFARTELFQPLGITDYEWLGPSDSQPPVPSAAQASGRAPGISPVSDPCISTRGSGADAKLYRRRGSNALSDGRRRSET